jgi:hypothetical protein
MPQKAAKDKKTQEKFFYEDIPDNTNTPLPDSFFARKFFTFMNPIIQQGNKFPYQFKMLFKHEKFIDREVQKELITAYMKKEIQINKDYTIFSFYRYGKKFLYPAMAIYSVISAISALLPFFIKRFIGWLVDPTQADSTGWYWALGLVLLRFTEFYLSQHFEILSGKGLLKLMASIPVRFTEISIFN